MLDQLQLIITTIVALVAGFLGFKLRSGTIQKQKRELDKKNAELTAWRQGDAKRKEIRDAEHFSDPDDARQFLRNGDHSK